MITRAAVIEESVTDVALTVVVPSVDESSTPAASVKVGKLIKLDARTDKAAVVTWTSKTKKVCSVVMKKGKPNVKGLKKGLCRVKAVAVGVGEYGAYSKTIALYVN